MGLLAATLVFFSSFQKPIKRKSHSAALKYYRSQFPSALEAKRCLATCLPPLLALVGCLLFVTAGSIVYIGIYGVPVDQFGYFFMMNIVTMIFASFLNSRFVTKVGAETMLRIALAIQFLSGMWLILTTLLDLGFGQWQLASPFRRSKPSDFIKCNGISFRKMSSNGGNNKFFDW